MYFDEPRDAAPIEPGTDVRWLLSANGLAVLILGVMPGSLMALCLVAVQGLYPLAR
jgi:NADH-quinone oxidoreductase subunit N